MTISIIGTPTRVTNAAGATLTVLADAGIADGDYTLVAITAVLQGSAWAPPAGLTWTTLVSQTTVTPNQWLYGRTWRTGDATSWAFAGGSTSVTAYSFTLRSSVGTLAADGAGSAHATSPTTSAAITYDSLTPSATTDILIALGAANSTQASFSTPSGMTAPLAYLSQSGMSSDAYYQILTTNTATGAKTSTVATARVNCGTDMLLKEVAAATDIYPLRLDPYVNAVYRM